MPLARRMSNSSVASASSSQSFPATVNSSTKVSKAKVGKIMTRRKKSRIENQKSGNKENESSVLLSPTPYWKVAKERGTNRETPPKTRSTKKRKTDQNDEDVGLMIFSPPDQAANAIREREENERKLQERASRVQKARTGGQLLVFSPTFRNPAPLPADGEAELVQDGATKTEDADAVNGDAVELNESHEDSTTTPFNMEVEVPVHESEKSQLSLSTRTLAADKNAEEIKNELKCLRETLNQFVASKNSDAEVRQQQSSLELHMIRTENVLVENSKLQLKIEEVEESMKENLAKAAGEKWTLNDELVQLQNKLTCVSHDAQSYLKALEEVKREFVIHSQGSSTEKEALLLQIHSLQAELEETRLRLAERESLLGALKKEHFAERKHLTDEHEDKLRNTRADFEAKILELSMSNNALKQIVVEYEAKIFSLEKSLLPESEAQLAQALSKLKRFEEDEVELRDRLSGYHQRIHEMTKDLQEAREEQEEERRNFQQLNQESSKAYDQIQRTIDEKDKVIQCLTCDIEQTSQALISATKKVQELSCELEKVQATMDTRTHDLTEMFKEVKSQLDSSTKEKQQLERKLGETLEGIKENAAFINQEVMARNNETSAANKVLTGRIEHLLQELQRSKKECDDTKTRLATFDQREAELFNKLQESDRVRRGLHNRVMQLSGNIRVYVRVRPTIPGERHEGSEVTQGHKKRKHVEMETSSPFSYPGLGGNEATKSTLGADDPTKNLLEVQEPWTDRGGLSERRKKWTFGFDSIFTPHHGQNDIWEATEPLVQSAIDGYNVTVFAYGQTGSGKTYTMLGEPGEEGIVSRSIRMLFTAKESIAELTGGKSKVEISVELLEIYNEKVRDLLVSGKSDQNLKVKANEAVGSTVLPVDSENDVVEILHTAHSRRCVKATKSNAVSSRSHMLFTLHFKVSSKDGKSRVGKLNVCDLAGSERLGKSNANETVGGALLTETKHINSSLSVLSNVIEKLQAGDSNVPYRESKLTYLLQNSLGGNSKTLAIVCCNPLQSHFHESLCSLRFAAKVNKVDLKAVANFSA